MRSYFSLIAICTQLLLAQSIIGQKLQGRVFDELSKEPIAFANVVYSEGAGTVTDIDGKFVIRTDVDIKELKVSCLGYAPAIIPIEKLQKGNEVFLMPLKYSLPTINVMPSENPAIKIMKQVIANRKVHNPESYDPFSCVIYHKMTIDFDWPKELNEEELAEMKDSLGIINDSYLFLFESVSEKKHLRKGVEKEKVISGRVSGLKDPLLASFPAVLQPFSFYNQYIELLGLSYLNPASSSGLSMYQFILEETYVNSLGDSVFYISYRPKEDRNFRGLTGAFHIDGNSSAIKTVSATTTGTENGLRLFIRQNYQPLENGKWFPKQLESSLQFGSLGASKRLPFPLIGKGKSYVTAINTQAQFSEKEFDNVVMEDLSTEPDAPNVAAFRYEPLTAKDSITYHFIDSIGRKNHLDAILKTQVSLIKGYLPIGALDLDLSKVLDYNDFEGLKLGLGLYTSSRVSKNFSAGGYYTYGFGDKDGKYGVKLSVMPLKNKENRAYVEYHDDVLPTGTFEFLDGVKVNSSESFSRFLTETMDLSQQWEAGVDFRFLNFFKTRLFYKNGDVSPQKPYRFDNDFLAPDYSFDEMGLKLKWANKETFINSAFGRISNGTKWPVVWLNAAVGQWEEGDTYNYQKYEGRIHKRFNYPNAMHTTLRIEGGYIQGDYLSTMLYSALGSYKSFTIFVPYTFGTMRLNEFGTNEFASLYFSHAIPLSLNTNNRIKPEIVLCTNVAYGNAPEGIQTINKGFCESGLYLKNLFSSFIFQYGVSAHYRYGAYSLPNEIDNWAFKLGLEFSF